MNESFSESICSFHEPNDSEKDSPSGLMESPSVFSISKVHSYWFSKWHVLLCHSPKWLFQHISVLYSRWLACGENYGNGIEFTYGRNSQYVCLGHIAYEHEQSVHIDILIDH